MPKLCPHCSVDLADGSTSCWHCHHAVDLSSAPEAPAKPVPAKPAAAAPPPQPRLPPPDLAGIKRALLIEAAILGVGLLLWKTGLIVFLGAPLFVAIAATLLMGVARWAGSREEFAGPGVGPKTAYFVLMLAALPVALLIAFFTACFPMWAAIGHL